MVSEVKGSMGRLSEEMANSVLVAVAMKTNQSAEKAPKPNDVVSVAASTASLDDPKYSEINLELDGVRTQLKDVLMHNELLEKELHDLRSTSSIALLQRNEEIDSLKSSHDAQAMDLLSQIDQLKADSSVLQETIADLQNDHNRNTLIKDSKIDALSSELKNFREQLQLKSGAVSELENACTALEIEILSLRSELEFKEHALSNSSSKLQETQSKLSAEMTVHNELSSEINRLTEELAKSVELSEHSNPILAKLDALRNKFDDHFL